MTSNTTVIGGASPTSSDNTSAATPTTLTTTVMTGWRATELRNRTQREAEGWSEVLVTCRMVVAVGYAP